MIDNQILAKKVFLLKPSSLNAIYYSLILLSGIVFIFKYFFSDDPVREDDSQLNYFGFCLVFFGLNFSRAITKMMMETNLIVTITMKVMIDVFVIFIIFDRKNFLESRINQEFLYWNVEYLFYLFCILCLAVYTLIFSVIGILFSLWYGEDRVIKAADWPQ